MKNTIKLLVVVVAAMVITACSKKNDSSPTSEIVGKWTIVSDTVRTYQSGTLIETDANTALAPTDFAQFNSNGTGSTTESGSSNTFTYSLSGNTLTLKTPAQTVDGTAIPASTETATVKTLTSSVMHLYETNSYSISGTSYTANEDIHFTK